MKKILLLTILTIFGLFVQSQSTFILVDTITHNVCFGDHEGNIQINLQADISGTIAPGPYIWQWSNGDTTQNIEMLDAGWYFLTLTDGSAQIHVDSFLVSDPAPLELNANISNVSTLGLNDGEIAVSVSGGTPPYSYQWTNGNTNHTVSNLYGGLIGLFLNDSLGCSIDSLFEVGSPHPAGWTVDTTGSSHTVQIQNNCVEFDGLPLSYGSQIGVFYEENGQDICAGSGVWNGFAVTFMVYGADPGQSNGMPDGTVFKWLIYDVASDSVYSAAPCIDYTCGGNGTFVPFQKTCVTCIRVHTNYSMNLLLKQGWSIISLYLDPNPSNMEDIFAPVVNDLKLIKSGLGQVYWPYYNVNQIGDFDFTKSYWARMDAPNQYLQITGDYILPEQHPLFIPQGWSMFGYYSTTPANVETFFQCAPFLPCEVEIIKSGNGSIWWPYWQLNTIGFFAPGEGYQIFANYPIVITLPPHNCN